jgi:transcriptional regulator with XRE-family HTH domain
VGEREKDSEAFAQELKAQREVAGLTQEQVAKLMGYSPSVIAKLETCRTIPSPQHAAQADEALRTPGTFRRLRQAMINGAYEPWVRALLEMEERATVLRNWESLVVPGLLQTETYARAMIRAGPAIPMLKSSNWSRRECPGSRFGSAKRRHRQCCSSCSERRFCANALATRR